MTVRYRRHPEVRLAALEGEGVVLHLGTRRYFTLSESGLSIFEALASPRTFDEVVVEVVTRYEVTAASAQESVREFLDRCHSADLLVVEPGP